MKNESPVSTTPLKNLVPVSATPVINDNDIDGKLSASFNDTGDERVLRLQVTSPFEDTICLILYVCLSISSIQIK